MEEIANYVPQMYATFWALIPPVVAIVLALITKEVYGCFKSEVGPEQSTDHNS